MNLDHKIPPPVVAVFMAFGMWAIGHPVPPLSGPRLWGTVLLALAGVAFDLSGLWAFRRARTTINPLSPHKASALVSGGIYRVTRNPMYVGLALLLSAWAVVLASPWGLLGPVGFGLWVDRFQIQPEEAVLRAKFGAEFEAYAARVRRWL